MLGRLTVSLGDYVRWLILHLFILPSCPLTLPPKTQLAPIPDPVWRSDSSSFSSLSSSSKRRWLSLGSPSPAKNDGWTGRVGRVHSFVYRKGQWIPRLLRHRATS